MSMFTSNTFIKISVIVAALILSLGIYIRESYMYSGGVLIDKLVQIYGVWAVVCLIATMLAGPLYRIFPNFPLKGLYRSSLGGLGISSFYFAFLHAYNGFFGVLLGFSGLGFLSSTFLAAVILGFIPLLILAAMAGTSFTYAMKKLGKRWKQIHRLVYIAGICIIIHTLLIGSDFRDFTQPLPFALIVATTLMLILQLISTYRFLVAKYPHVSSRLFTASISALFVGSYYIFFLIHEAVNGGHVH